MPESPDVLVIGGGVAGLAAAERLAKAGRRVTVLEGRDRLGGRIHTLHDPESPLAIELGAEFVHGENVPTWPLLQRAGLETWELLDHHERRDEDKPTRFPDIVDALGHVLEGADRKPDRPLADLLAERRAAGDDPDQLDAVARFVQGFHAADLTRAGTHGLIENDGGEDGDGYRQFRFPHGYDGLVRNLTASLDPRQVDVRTSTTVTGIGWTPKGIQVETRGANGTRSTWHAPAAIVTLPLSLLKAAARGDGPLKLGPWPEGWREALDTLEMGSAERMVLRFDAPWWNDDHARPGFVHGEGVPFPVWWTLLPSEGPLIVGWVGGPPAAELSGLPEPEVRRRAIASLAKIFGRSKDELAGRLRAAYYHDWDADPFSRGAYSYGGIGASEGREVLRRPAANRLYLAGEALAEGGRNGTVHGALADGWRAADRLLASG
jgi:monoamine oxidase